MTTSATISSQDPIRVMIVDDHKSVVWGLERLVESAHPRMEMVGTATSCADMLATVGVAKPDVILLDLDLNGENAIDALPDLQRICHGRVLILTGARDPNIHQAAVMKGVHGVIGKDESADVLLRAIERVHAGEIWINRLLMGKLLGAMSANAGRDADPDADKIASLTKRERDIIQAMVRNRGDKSQVIAEALHISEHTLRNHLTVIYDKLGARNRLDLFAFATEHGLVAD